MQKLRVSHYPQIPCKPFHVDVNSIEEALKIIDVLAYYDLFQYKNRIKPDYVNATILEVWDENSDGEGNADWVSWMDEDGFEISDYALVNGRAILSK